MEDFYVRDIKWNDGLTIISISNNNLKVTMAELAKHNYLEITIMNAVSSETITGNNFDLYDLNDIDEDIEELFCDRQYNEYLCCREELRQGIIEYTFLVLGI